MSLSCEIKSVDTNSVSIMGKIVRVGEYVAAYGTDTDDVGFPCTVAGSNDVIEGDGDFAELRDALRDLGFTYETDYDGVRLSRECTA